MNKPVDYQQKVMELLNGDEELLAVIQNEIKEHKISETTYAKVLSDLYFTKLGSDECVSYSKGAGQWRCGKKRISDLRLVAMISTVSDVIRYAILGSWQSCLVASLVKADVTKELETALDEMESLDHVQGILNIAKGLMVFANRDGQISWSDIGDDGEDAPVPELA